MLGFDGPKMQELMRLYITIHRWVVFHMVQSTDPTSSCVAADDLLDAFMSHCKST